MNTDQLLDVASYVGKLLTESGAEIYRVEETMMRLCASFSEVEDARDLTTTTSIMLSITVTSRTHTRALRVHARGVDLNYIDKINSLSRGTAVQSCTIGGLALELKEIENEQRYSLWIIMFFGALNTGGFTVFFSGNYLETGYSFLIGLLIKAVSTLIEQRGLHGFFMDATTVVGDTLATLEAHVLYPNMDVDILIISNVMLFAPDLAAINVIRDTVSGDYLSGVACATEAFLIVTAIATGIGVVLSISIGLNRGM